MKTIVKVPLYLEVEHEEKDRARAVSGIQRLIIPELVSHLVSYGNKVKFTQDEMQILGTFLGKFSAKLVNEVTAMVKKP